MRGRGHAGHPRRARLSAEERSRCTIGVGLASMRERLHQIGGRLEIESVVGHTSVKAIIPLRDEAAV